MRPEEFGKLLEPGVSGPPRTPVAVARNRDLNRGVLPCASQVELKRGLSYRHVSETITGPNGEDMSIRAEVGLLSRNVRIVGSTDKDGTEDFGAHVMMLKVDRAQFEYVELTHVGQAHQLGRYPIHFHVSAPSMRRCGCLLVSTRGQSVGSPLGLR